MKRHSLMLVAPRRLEWIEEELPPLRLGEVLVQSTTGAVSVGSELPQLAGEEQVGTPQSYPRMTGYESVGVAVKRGAGVRSVQVGDRVVASYGHRTHGVVREPVIPVPAEVPDAIALLSILTCDVAKGISKVEPGGDEAVLIVGGGAIGLLTVAMLRARGAGAVDVIEPDPGRRELARSLGARWVGSCEFAAGEYPVGFECSGRDAGFRVLQERMSPAGRICILSDGNVEPLTLQPYFHERELLLIGSSDGLDYREHARWFFENRCSFGSLEQLFQMEVGAARLAEVFRGLAEGEISPVKVLVRYSKEVEV